MKTGITIHTGYTPHRFQQDIHAGLRRFSVLVCHRRFGKTVLCVNALIDAAHRDGPPDQRLAYVAPTLTQAKRVAWDYLKRYALGIPGSKASENELRIDFENGSRISLHGADNPDSLRGLYLDGAVLDEYADFRPEAYATVIRPALSDRRGFAIFIGTPRGHNHFFDLYQAALRNPGWFAARFPASATRLLPEDELDSARSQMTDAQFRQEYECDFDVTGEDTLIPLALVLDSLDRQVGYRDAPAVMGLDVGMSLGGDPSAIVVRQGGRVVHAEEFRLDDTLVVAGRARECFHDFRPEAVYVDAVGWGAGVAHTLSGWGLPVTAVNVAESSSSSERFNRRRDELWWKAREFFASRVVCLDEAAPLVRKLAAELSSPRFAYLPSGRIKVEGKDELKRRGVSSPNLADAFVLTMAHADRFRPADDTSNLEEGQDPSRFL
ncbi:terminase large subunit domain-containing protein [Fundidesulfovibrio terrae]|uniref:terminase large subunit domain-containing protein n=1 Tax=Fundidesulfovibrio terrae TaxID=2922866 RepID=UPI001FAF7D9A|nr:terminase family protein [Fundidesulfovibrio terrae]